MWVYHFCCSLVFSLNTEILSTYLKGWFSLLTRFCVYSIPISISCFFITSPPASPKVILLRPSLGLSCILFLLNYYSELQSHDFLVYTSFLFLLRTCLSDTLLGCLFQTITSTQWKPKHCTFFLRLGSFNQVNSPNYAPNLKTEIIIISHTCSKPRSYPWLISFLYSLLSINYQIFFILLPKKLLIFFFSSMFTMQIWLWLYQHQISALLPKGLLWCSIPFYQSLYHILH